MRVTCWLEQLPNKADLTSWIFTVACDHRKILQFFDLAGVPMFGDPFEQVGQLAHRFE